MKPTYHFSFNIKDKKLVDFLETTFSSKTIGIIESIQKNYDTYNKVDNPHENNLINAPITLKKRIIKNMSFKDYENLGFMLSELNGIYNSKKIIDIQHEKRDQKVAA